MVADRGHAARCGDSPWLAHLYLHPLDERMGGKGYRMVRYADDFVVVCRSREEAEAALSDIRGWVEENGLELHPDKTHLGDARQAGEGFEFLGYRFEAGRRWVRKKSLVRLKDAIRAKRRTRGASLAQVLGDLNPTLRGWFGYFKHAHPITCPMLDGFDYAPSCANKRNAPALGVAMRTINAGPMPASRKLGCSPSIQPARRETLPMRTPTNWRAVCGKTARTVRRAGRAQAFPDLYRSFLELIS